MEGVSCGPKVAEGPGKLSRRRCSPRGLLPCNGGVSDLWARWPTIASPETPHRGWSPVWEVAHTSEAGPSAPDDVTEKTKLHLLDTAGGDDFGVGVNARACGAANSRRQAAKRSPQSSLENSCGPVERP